MLQQLKKIDPFIAGLIIMLILAWAIPFEGELKATIPLKTIIYWGVSGIFFLYGLKLDLKKIKEDMMNWKLHLTIQSTTFLLFPLIVLIFYPFFKNSSYEELWMATFFLAVLPSTVSSSVVMISIAKGNLPAGIFNASISGLIGLFLTPLWMSVFMRTRDTGNTFSSLTEQLFLQILLPVIVGLLLNYIFGNFVRKHSKTISWFDKIIIFLIVYKSFSSAFTTGMFEEIVSSTIITLSALMIVLFALVFIIVSKVSKKLKFSIQDQITAIFCGSKKSLVHGSVFVTLIIPDLALQSLYLLPIMIYHAFQLFFTSYIARKWAKSSSSMN